MDETLAAIAASRAIRSGGVTYQVDTFNLAALQAAGAVTNAEFTGAALPANARVMAMEMLLNNTFTGAGLTHAWAYVAMDGVGARLVVPTSGNDLAAPGALFAQDLGTPNAYVTQGGNHPLVEVNLTGGTTFAGLTNGSVTIRTFYAVIP
jgi:hypothetical protein